MDPTALAATATALLAPYIAKAGEKLAEKVGEKLPEQIGKLWTTIAAKFKGKPAAEEAVKDLAANPKDEDNQAAFRKELKKLLAEDDGFVNELAKLLQAAQVAHAESGDIFIGDNAFKVGENYGTIVYGSENVNVKSGDANVGNTTNTRQGGIDNSGSITVGSGDVTGDDKTL